MKYGHHDNGCAWSGSIADYSAHMENNCSVSKNPTVQNNSAVMEELERLRLENDNLRDENDNLRDENDNLRDENDNLRNERDENDLAATQQELSTAKKDFEIAKLLLEDLQKMPRNATGNAEDIYLVMRHTACDRSEAVHALKENDNKVYSAILSFTDTDYMKDIDLVMRQAGCTRRDAIKALIDHDNDLVYAIMSLCEHV